MYAVHAHKGRTTGERKARKLADTSYVIQLTQRKKCCNITKVVVGKVKYIFCACILVYKYKKCIL